MGYAIKLRNGKLLPAIIESAFAEFPNVVEIKEVEFNIRGEIQVIENTEISTKPKSL